ncbi:hypothetical protein BDB00DRAFT_872822 [Zychaea mexicana]|uniref:uncharacterized protein n=1 Tax=Zychaea mexicana TaxID=64656 RepID=UPI0022FEFA0C|nr:uncharacterized protein BDB00DRAFT_872822 [Zychaea mexicana]KAI9492969.1 hypothetical protein BDB00DRAFT_872822 [Zychaea mexicana]
MTTFASDWRFKNYSDWHENLVPNGKKTANRLYDEYHSDLVKIKAYSGSPHTIKGFVGRLLNEKEKNYDQEPVKTTTIYKDSIVGGHNNTLIHTHDQGQSSGKSDGNSDDQSYHTQKDDATSQATPDVRRPPLNSANYNTTSNSGPSNSYDDELDYEATPNTIDTHPDADDQYVFDFVKTNNLTVESDSYLILSMSSILLLQNNNRLNHAMIPFFGDKLYSKICKHNLGEWNMTLKFPGNVLLESIIIAQNLYDETTDRINACASLLILASTIDDPIDKRLLVSGVLLLVV